MKKVLSVFFLLIMFASFAQAQTAEVTVSLNEQFFDALLDAIFKNFKAPEFPLTGENNKFEVQPKNTLSAFQAKSLFAPNNQTPEACRETIRLQREIDGTRTAVKFRDGKIYTPLAFNGSYNPPLVGCIDFQGWAETNVVLEFDKQSQKLLGRVQVLNVQLSGAGGIGSAALAKFVQSAIDKKINPIEILQTDKLSFIVPLQNSGGSLRMKATGVNTEIVDGSLNVRIAYEFSKAN